MTSLILSDDIRAAFDECRTALQAPPAPSQAPAAPAWYGRRADTAVPLTALGLRCLASYLGNLNPHNRGDV